MPGRYRSRSETVRCCDDCSPSGYGGCFPRRRGDRQGSQAPGLGKGLQSREDPDLGNEEDPPEGEVMVSHGDFTENWRRVRTSCVEKVRIKPQRWGRARVEEMPGLCRAHSSTVRLFVLG